MRRAPSSARSRAPASGAPSSGCAGWASWPAEPAVPEGGIKGGMKGGPRDEREADEIRVSLVLATVDRVAEPMRFVESRSEEHTSELQSRENLVCRLL